MWPCVTVVPDGRRGWAPCRKACGGWNFCSCSMRLCFFLGLEMIPDLFGMSLLTVISSHPRQREVTSFQIYLFYIYSKQGLFLVQEVLLVVLVRIEPGSKAYKASILLCVVELGFSVASLPHPSPVFFSPSVDC